MATKTIDVRETLSDNEKRVKQLNILYILVDDASMELFNGWNYMAVRFGWVGSIPRPTTSNINTYIAGRGVKFSNFYTMPVCSSHRICVLTGRYPTRHGCGSVVMPQKVSDRFNESSGTYSKEYTLAHLLGDAGYRTLLCGKGHMALVNDQSDEVPPWNATPYDTLGTGWTHPITKQGFTEFRGVFRNLNNQAPEPADFTATDAVEIKPGYHNFNWNELRADTEDPDNNFTQVGDQYITTYSRERLQDWILNPHVDDVGKPWFACWALNAAHSPWGARATAGFSGSGPPDDVDHVHNTGYNDSQIWSTAFAAVENIDIEIKNLHDAMGDEMWNRTMIFFMSDNGTDSSILKTNISQNPAYTNQYGVYDADVINATPEKMKGTLYSGGTRAVLAVAGPLVVNTAVPSEAMVDSVDVFATIKRIALGDGVVSVPDNAVRTVDGVDFLDIIRDVESDTTNRHRSWSYSEHFQPNGSASAVTDPSQLLINESTNHSKVRVYRRKFVGDALDTGTFHLLRSLTGVDTYTEELYRVYNNAGAKVDMNEVTDEFALGTYDAELLIMQTELDALIAEMEADVTQL